MAKISKNFRLEESTLKKLQQLIEWEQDNYDMLGLGLQKKITATDVIEIAINERYRFYTGD